MNSASTRESFKKEKDLYYTVLSFLKDVRKKGKPTPKEWSNYLKHLKGLSLSPEMYKAADMWAMENLDQFHPETTMLPPLNDMEAVGNVSKEFLSQLMEALYYGMLNLTQANLISDEIQDADPDCITTASLEDLLVKLWIGNAKTYKKIILN